MLQGWEAVARAGCRAGFLSLSSSGQCLEAGTGAPSLGGGGRRLQGFGLRFRWVSSLKRGESQYDCRGGGGAGGKFFPNSLVNKKNGQGLGF